MANALIRKTGIYLVGNLAARATSTLIIPIYAYFVTPEALGMYDYFLTLMQMCSPLIFLAIWEAVLRYVLNEKDPGARDASVSNVVALALMSALVLTVLMFAVSLSLPVHRGYVLMTALMTFSISIGQIWQYLARSYGRARLYAASGIAAAVANLAGILFSVVFLRMQLEGLVGSFVLGQVAVVVVIETRLRLIRRLQFRYIRWSILRKLVSFSFPLAVNLLLLAFVTGLGRVLITNTIGSRANGLYSFAMKFGVLVTALGGIFAMAVVEEAILRIGKPNSDKFFTDVVHHTAALLLSLSLIALPIVKLFYTAISSTSYVSSYSMVPSFLSYAVCTVLGTVMGCVFQTSQRTRLIAVSSLIGASATTILSFLLIRSFGADGVALALFLGSLFMMLARYFFGRRLIRYRLVDRRLLILIFLFAMSVVLGQVPIVAASRIGLLGWTALSVVSFLPVLIRSMNGLRGIPDAS